MGKAETLRPAVRILRTGADAIIGAVLAPCCVSCTRVLDAPLDGCVCPVCWDEARASAGRYDGALRHVIHAFKYEGRRSLAPALGALLHARAGRLLEGADCAVPVPLFPSRWLRRGFNQAALLARHLERPVVHALWRIHPTRAQMGLNAHERRRNVRGAFRLSPLLRRHDRETFIEDRVIVLVDDVMTTGATLNACAAVLTLAGAREVRRLTLARAPVDSKHKEPA